MDYKMEDERNLRKADNRILAIRKKNDTLDEKIASEKIKLEKLTDMQESVDAIVENINECIDLLSKSIKGPNTENIFNDMYATNKNFQVNVSTNIENSQADIKSRIDRMYKEKDRILEKSREIGIKRTNQAE